MFIIFEENYKEKFKFYTMKRIIAVPLTSGILSAHFGHCEQFAFVETEDNKVVSEKTLTPPPHEPGLLPKWVSQNGASDVIAGGMGQRAIDLFNGQNINVFVGAPQKNHRELVEDLINNKLQAGANYCDH